MSNRRTRLTPRQHEYARLAAAGHTRMEIAQRLGVAISTVDVMVGRLYRRLGVSTRRELATALLACRVVAWNGGGRPSRFGLEPGDSVHIVDGRFAGRGGTYIGSSNSRQVRIQIGAGVFALRAAFVRLVVELTR